MKGYYLSNPEPITTAIMLEFVKKNGMFSKRVIYKWSNDNNNGIDNDNILKTMTLKIMIMTKTMIDKTQKQ